MKSKIQILGIAIVITFAIYKFGNIDFKSLFSGAGQTLITQNTDIPDSLDNVKVEYILNKIEDNHMLATSLQDILSRGELVVCSIKNELSKIFRSTDKNGIFSGKDIHFAKKMAKILGVKLKIKMFYETYDEVVDAIQNGDGDVGISHLSYTPSRSLKVLFSEPYVLLNSLILLNKKVLNKAEKTDLHSVLNNKNAVLTPAFGSSYVDLGKKLFSKARIVEFHIGKQPTEKVIRDLKFDAFIFDELETKCILRDNRDLSLLVLPIIIKGQTDGISAIVNFKSSHVLLWINEFIKRLETPENADSLMERFKVD